MLGLGLVWERTYERMSHSKRRGVSETAAVVEKAPKVRHWVTMGVNGGGADVRIRPLTVTEATYIEILAALRRAGHGI